MTKMNERAGRIMQSMERLGALLKAEPDHPKSEAWKERWNEYVVSLKNIKEFGQESIPTNNPTGVDIDVPASMMKMKTLDVGA